jgi:hypothetical protein
MDRRYFELAYYERGELRTRRFDITGKTELELARIQRRLLMTSGFCLLVETGDAVPITRWVEENAPEDCA